MTKEELDAKICSANDRFNRLPRWEQIELERGMRIAWILDRVGLAHTDHNRELVNSIILRVDAENKPRPL